MTHVSSLQEKWIKKSPVASENRSDQNEVTLPENLVWHTIIFRSGRDPDCN